MPLTPVTVTIVTVPSATASWIIPDWKTSPPARSKALRRTGSHVPITARRPQRELGRAAVRGVAHVRRRRARVRDAADRDDAPAARRARPRSRGPASISARVGVRFDVAVPGCVGTTFQSSTSLGEPELAEHAVDDRRRRLGRARAGQLPLGGERDPRDAGAAVAGRLADEQDRRVRALVEIRREAGAPQRSARADPVEVRGLPDPGGREPVDERAHRDPHSDGRRPTADGDRARSRGVRRRGGAPHSTSRSTTSTSARRRRRSSATRSGAPRRAACASASSTTSATRTRSRCRRRRSRTSQLIATLPVEEQAIAGIPDLMHHKFVIRDGSSVWTGSVNWTDDSFVAPGERARDRALGGDREGVRDRLRPAVGNARRRAHGLRRPALGSRRARVVHARPRRGLSSAGSRS